MAHMKTEPIKQATIERVFALGERLGSKERAYEAVAEAAGGKISKHGLVKICQGKRETTTVYLDKVIDALDVLEAQQQEAA